MKTECIVQRRMSEPEEMFAAVTTDGHRFACSSQVAAEELAKRWNAHAMFVQLAYMVMEGQQNGFSGERLIDLLLKAENALKHVVG